MRLSQTPKQREWGFTLIEMMIVVAVAAIMAGIAVPAFMSMLPGMRLNGAARQVMTDLMAARMDAVKQNNQFKMFFLDNHQYKILDDNDNDGIDDGIGTETSRTINIQDNYSDITFTSTNDPIFTPRGTATNLATITLQNSSGSKAVTISIAGRVKIN